MLYSSYYLISKSKRGGFYSYLISSHYMYFWLFSFPNCYSNWKFWSSLGFKWLITEFYPMNGEGSILRGDKLGEVKEGNLNLLANWPDGVDGCELLFLIIYNV